MEGQCLPISSSFCLSFSSFFVFGAFLHILLIATSWPVFVCLAKNTCECFKWACHQNLAGRCWCMLPQAHCHLTRWQSACKTCDSQLSLDWLFPHKHRDEHWAKPLDTYLKLWLCLQKPLLRFNLVCIWGNFTELSLPDQNCPHPTSGEGPHILPASKQLHQCLQTADDVAEAVGGFHALQPPVDIASKSQLQGKKHKTQTHLQRFRLKLNSSSPTTTTLRYGCYNRQLGALHLYIIVCFAAQCLPYHKKKSHNFKKFCWPRTTAWLQIECNLSVFATRNNANSS